MSRRPYFHQRKAKRQPPKPCRRCGRGVRTLNANGLCGLCAVEVGQKPKKNWAVGAVGQ